MNAQIFQGSRQEILDALARFDGEIREVIVVVAEPPEVPFPGPEEDVFAEMNDHVVGAADADFSREAIYARLDGE